MNIYDWWKFFFSGTALKCAVWDMYIPESPAANHEDGGNEDHHDVGGVKIHDGLEDKIEV